MLGEWVGFMGVECFLGVGMGEVEGWDTCKFREISFMWLPSLPRLGAGWVGVEESGGEALKV